MDIARYRTGMTCRSRRNDPGHAKRAMTSERRKPASEQPVLASLRSLRDYYVKRRVLVSPGSFRRLPSEDPDRSACPPLGARARLVTALDEQAHEHTIGSRKISQPFFTRRSERARTRLGNARAIAGSRVRDQQLGLGIFMIVVARDVVQDSSRR